MAFLSEIMTDLKDLEPLSKRLNAATDELNNALKTIQNGLNALGIGLEVWLDSPTTALDVSDWKDVLNEDESVRSRVQTRYELGYGRLGEGWTLLVRTRRITRGTDGSEYVREESQRQTLLHASRAHRVAAVAYIPVLIERLESEAKKVIERVEEAKKSLKLES